MKTLFRELRLVPVVLLAAATLFIIKTTSLLLDGGYVLAGPRQAQAQNAMPAGRDGNAASVTGPDRSTAPDPATAITGSTGPAGGAGSAPANKLVDPRLSQMPVIVKFDPNKPVVSAGERVVLERLNERRHELESRSRDLDMRENLLKAAEKKLESRLAELKELETKVGGAIQKRDEAEMARFKSIVTMYENMKAKEAAKIFDRLDMKVLIEVAEQINPRRMSDILALMNAEAAERLTVELANRANGNARSAAAELPKIEGRPTPN